MCCCTTQPLHKGSHWTVHPHFLQLLSLGGSVKCCWISCAGWTGGAQVTLNFSSLLFLPKWMKSSYYLTTLLKKKNILLAHLEIKSAQHLIIRSNNMIKDADTVRTYNVRLFQKRNCCLQTLKLQCNLDFRLFQPLNRSFNQSMVVPVPAPHHRSRADPPSSLQAVAPAWAWIPQVGTNRAYRYWWDLLQSTDCCPVPTVSKEQAVCWRKQGVLERENGEMSARLSNWGYRN